MTIQELINKVTEEKPNAFKKEKLVQFVNEIEADVADQLHLRHRPYEVTDLSQSLLVPAPYDRLYVSYVKAMIDYANEELMSYQNNQMQHVQDFHDFLDWVVRTGQATEDAMPARLMNVF